MQEITHTYQDPLELIWIAAAGNVEESDRPEH